MDAREIAMEAVVCAANAYHELCNDKMWSNLHRAIENYNAVKRKYLDCRSQIEEEEWCHA